MPPDRPHRTARGTYALAACAASLPATLQGVALNPELMQGGLVNPDSAMRLVRLHDILATGVPLHAVMRDGSGAGTLLHWSHLLDSLVVLAALPAATLLGWPAALHLVALLAGPVMLAGLGMALVWAIAPLTTGGTAGWSWLAAAGAGTAPGIAGYGLMGALHHHVLLAVAAVMACGWALRLLHGAPSRPGGLAMGAWAGAGLWLSPATLPFSLMALGLLWVAWLHHPSRALSSGMTWFGAGFTCVAAAAWAVDPPAAGWAAIESDWISLPFILLAGTTLTSGLVARASHIRRLALAYIAGTAAIWLLMMPEMLGGTEAVVPASVAATMFDGIEEMSPVGGLRDVLCYLPGGLFALGVTLAWVVRRPGPMQAYLAACCAGMLALAALHMRFCTYPALAGAALLPLAAGWLGTRASAPRWHSFARVGMALPLLLGPVLVPATARAGAAEAAGAARCRISGAVALLRPFPDQVVLSDVNDVPELLYRTKARTVGSLYHRGAWGFMRLRAAWRSIPDDGPDHAAEPAREPIREPGIERNAELAATGATLLLACPGAARSHLVADLPRTTLLDRVQAGHPPPGLRRLGDAGPGGFVLYAVEP